MNRKKTVLQCILFVFLFLPAILLAGWRFEAASANNLINAHTRQRFDDFYQLEENSLDMVFIGSSHAYCTFDPELFDEAFGISSYQMGTPLQHADTAYYSLLEVLNYQTPKVVVYELYWGIVNQPFNLKQASAFFEVVQNEALTEQYINEVFPAGEKAKYYIKPIRYQQDYLAYKSAKIEEHVEKLFSVYKKTAQKNGIEEYKSKGFVYCDMVITEEDYDTTNQFKGADGRHFKFDPAQKLYLEKMAALCEERGIQLIFVTAPVANVSLAHITAYEEINRKVSEFSRGLNIPYIDYNIVNKELDLLQNSDFRDDAHLNYAGVEKVDAHFIQWLENIDGFRQNIVE